jgi:hypothetical protein
MIEGSQQLKFREIYAKSVKTGQSDLRNRIIQFQNRTVRFGKPDHPILSAKPQKPKHLIFKTGTSSFSRLNILIRKHTPMISLHSHIHICINRT